MRFLEQNKRSILKAVTFRCVIIVADSIVVYAFTRRADITAGFVLISNISSTILYYLHERVWNRLTWGKAVQPNGDHLDSNRSSISSSSQPK